MPGRLSMSRGPSGVYARSCPPSAGDLVRVRVRVGARVRVRGRVRLFAGRPVVFREEDEDADAPLDGQVRCRAADVDVPG